MTRKQWLRLLLYFAIVCGSTLIGILAQSSALGHRVELRTYDFRFRLRGSLPQSEEAPVTIIAIDEESFSRIPEPLILWHGHYARVIDELIAGGAGAIGLDMLVSADVKPEGFREFSRVLLHGRDRGIPVILAYSLRGDQPAESLPLLVGALGEGSFAYINLTTDSDDFVRRQELFASGEDNTVKPGFALAIASAYSEGRHKPLRPLPGNDQTILINFRGPRHYNIISFVRALEASRKHDAHFFKEAFRDKIVLIARVGRTGDEDLHPTPLYYWPEIRQIKETVRTPGVEIHANVISTLLEGNFIRKLELRDQVLTSLLVVGLTAFLCFRFSPVIGVGMSALVLSGYLVIVLVWAFERGWWVFVVSPVTGAVLAIGLTAFTGFMLEGREKRNLRRLFKQYVNDDVIEKIIGNPDKLSLRGERKEITVLFADIRGFTTRSENSPAEVLVNHLNRYFAAMVREIQKHGGMVDKFIGDGIMALFGAPIEDPEAALHGVQAAQAMLAALQELNQELIAEKAEPIRIGIGIHSGEAVIGNIGSVQKMEYTAIGDVVNIASRIEGLNRELNSEILITGETYWLLQERIKAEYVDDKKLKGREKPVPVYRVFPL